MMKKYEREKIKRETESEKRMETMPPTVLVVEDERPIRNYLAEELSDSGYYVICAEDGKTGLARALEERPDFIVLDLILPFMDGMTMLGNLRKNGGHYGSTVPVLICTNIVSKDDLAKEKLASRGVVGYVVKNDLEDIQEAVSMVRYYNSPIAAA